MNRYQSKKSSRRPRFGQTAERGLSGLVHSAFQRVREALPGQSRVEFANQPDLPGFEIPKQKRTLLK